MLPHDLSIVIIGCGAPSLIPSYITETQCPYPIYSDPTENLHTILGMRRTLSLGVRDPDYIKHTIVAGMAKSIVQGVKRIPSGDVMSAGDMRLNGGEILFEVEGREPLLDHEKGNTGLASVSVSWCHRMANTRDHSEVANLWRILEIKDIKALRRRPERRRTTDVLKRSLSTTRHSLLVRTSSVSQFRSRPISHVPTEAIRD